MARGKLEGDDIRVALYLWDKGQDTLKIAKTLGVKEAAVYNTLSSLRDAFAKNKELCR